MDFNGLPPVHSYPPPPIHGNDHHGYPHGQHMGGPQPPGPEMGPGNDMMNPPMVQDFSHPPPSHVSASPPITSCPKIHTNT